MKLTSRFFIFALIIISITTVEAKLLDKIVGIVNSNIITLSQLDRLSSNIAIKKSVAPLVYSKDSYTRQEMLDITINKFLMRAKLAELGYTISDDQVEAQIKSNQERLGVDRNSLLGFLKQQGTSYDEYFETLREAIEYSYFINRVVQPLISISEQDVKNSYYKSNIKDTRMNFKYNLIDYMISKEFINKSQTADMTSVVTQYRSNGVLPDVYSQLNVINLDDMTEEGINPELNKLLKETDEGTLTKVIDFNNHYHVFFITKKDLVETEAYLRKKDKIRDTLFEQAVKVETALWFEREKNKHFIKTSL